MRVVLAAAVVLAFAATAAYGAECDQQCLDTYEPVCASNGITFQNECRLQVAACKAAVTFTLQHAGECTDAECPAACAEFYAPVCGSNQKTYGNECELELEACAQKAEVYAASRGECPEPAAACDTVCAQTYEPVCMGGADFGNRCEAEVQACKDGKSLTDVAITAGACAPTAACDTVCAQIYQPVCALFGTNELKTFPNACEAIHTTCNGIHTVSVLHEGTCTTRDKAALFQYGSPCMYACPMSYDPVCANDGRTYPNMCELRRIACGTVPHLVAEKTGECVDAPLQEDEAPSACAAALCPAGTRCVETPKECFTTPCEQFDCVPANDDDNGGDDNDECNFACPLMYAPVCGSDLRVYGNRCELEGAVCRARKEGKAALALLHEGVCVNEDCLRACPKNIAPVCGTNKLTYDNECHLQQAACEAGLVGQTLVKAYDGECNTDIVSGGTPDGARKLSLAVVIGGAVVGMVVLGAIVAAIVVVVRKRRATGFEPLLAKPADIYTDSFSNADLKQVGEQA